MRLQKWYNREEQCNQAFLELTPRQAERLETFLRKQRLENFPAETLTEMGELTFHGIDGITDSVRGLITVGVV